MKRRNESLDQTVLIQRLLDIDNEAYLTFGNEKKFECYIVGGSALILMGYISRATRDIDAIDAFPPEIKEIFKKYDMNMDVQVFELNFAEDFRERSVRLDLETKAVTFYTLSLEDIVVSKLCSDFAETRIHDKEDIRTPQILGSINWEILEKLKEQVKNQQFSSFTIENLDSNFREYIEENKRCDR